MKHPYITSNVPSFHRNKAGCVAGVHGGGDPPVGSHGPLSFGARTGSERRISLFQRQLCQVPEIFRFDRPVHIGPPGHGITGIPTELDERGGGRQTPVVRLL